MFRLVYLSIPSPRQVSTSVPPRRYSHPWNETHPHSLVLIPLVLALVFLGPRWLVIVATAVLAGLAAWEYLGLAEKGGAQPPRIAVVLALWPSLLVARNIPI